MGINHKVLDGLFMLENTKDINRHLSHSYSLYSDDITVAMEYLEKSGFIEDSEYKNSLKN